MIINFKFNNIQYQADLSKPLDISMPIREGDENPNCYRAEPPEFKTIISGDFIGSVSEGGPVNYQKVTITPHGNGTHTECVGHISPNGETINHALLNFHFLAQLITVEPAKQGEDLVIFKDEITGRLDPQNYEGLIIRTIPNGEEKLTRKYSGSNPPYFDAEVMEQIRSRGVNHLLVDLPSVDREVDEGKLAAHKNFWNYPQNIRKNATITELVYIPDFITDGIYLVNLQIISLETDACPSKPVLYRLGSA